MKLITLKESYGAQIKRPHLILIKLLKIRVSETQYCTGPGKAGSF
jgi:hypothetical protein